MNAKLTKTCQDLNKTQLKIISDCPAPNPKFVENGAIFGRKLKATIWLPYKFAREDKSFNVDASWSVVFTHRCLIECPDVWNPVEIGIDPADVAKAIAKWDQEGHGMCRVSYAFKYSGERYNKVYSG